MSTEKGISHYFLQFRKLTAALEDGLLVSILFTMVFIAMLQIVLRNFFDMGLLWGDSLLRAMVLWLGLLGAMIASRNHNHINIDILSRYLPQNIRLISHLITDLFTVSVCVLFVICSIRLLLYDFETKTNAFSVIPIWCIEIILPIGFGIIALRYLASAMYNLSQLSGNKT